MTAAHALRTNVPKVRALLVSRLGASRYARLRGDQDRYRQQAQGMAEALRLLLSGGADGCVSRGLGPVGPPLRAHLGLAEPRLRSTSPMPAHEADEFYTRPDGVEEVAWMRPHRDLIDGLPSRVPPLTRRALHAMVDEVYTRGREDADEEAGLTRQLNRAISGAALRPASAAPGEPSANLHDPDTLAEALQLAQEIRLGIVCPVHGMPDCSPLLNGCARLSAPERSEEQRLRDAANKADSGPRAAELHRAADQAEAAHPTGAELIAAERQRQIDVEGWTPDHDGEHRSQALAMAAACYALPASRRRVDQRSVPWEWPWHAGYWKPTPGDRVRELVKAGGLIAAEIDRLLAADRG